MSEDPLEGWGEARAPVLPGPAGCPAWAAGWAVRHRKRAVAPHMTELLVSLAHALEIFF